jgi:hypothetical protein
MAAAGNIGLRPVRPAELHSADSERYYGIWRCCFQRVANPLGAQATSLCSGPCNLPIEQLIRHGIHDIGCNLAPFRIAFPAHKILRRLAFPDKGEIVA